MARQPSLTRASLLDAVRILVSRDPALAEIVERHGTPPLWARRPGFATLVRIILEQQVSLASAAALFARLECEIEGGVAPASVAATGYDGLRSLGVTRQKADYVSALAEQVQAGRLRLDKLARRSDDEVLAALTSARGIGPWTARIYALMALRRPDVWPTGDLALQKAVAALNHLPIRMKDAEMVTIAERWRPWRAVAARILWHGYLSGRTPTQRRAVDRVLTTRQARDSMTGERHERSR